MTIPLRTILIMVATVTVVMAAAVMVIPPSPPQQISERESLQPPRAEPPPLARVNGQTDPAATPPSSAPAPRISMLAPTPPRARETAEPEDERLVQLRSADASERLRALDLIWETADTLPDRQMFADHVATLSRDSDPEVAELATRLAAFLRGEDLPTDEAAEAPDEVTLVDDVDPSTTGDWVEPLPADDAAQESSFIVPPDESETTASSAPAPDDSAQMTQLYNEALNNPDPQIRREAIAQSAGMVNTAALELLTQAVHDVDANNRLAALEGLEQLLQQGVTTSEQLASILEESTADSDERVVEFATRMLQQTDSSTGTGDQITE